MIPHRGNSSVEAVVGIVVVAVAVVGTAFFDWTWANPDGKLLPMAIGVVAAVAAAAVMVRKITG